MKVYRFLVALVFVLVLIAFDFVPAVQGVQQVELDVGGTAYEVNRDSLGKLYVSDAGAGVIWQINPTNNTYMTYPIGYDVRDAQVDSAGRIWWVDNAGTFGYINAGSNLSTHWSLTSNPPYSLQALAPDDQGGLWLGEADGFRLFHFNPSDRLLCTYYMPYGAFTHDMVYQAGYLWLGQWSMGQIYRIAPGIGSLSYTFWQEEYTSNYGPWGIAVDGSYVWWADYFHGAIARMDSSNGQTTFYQLPVGVSPRMIAVAYGRAWYSDESSNLVGTLNPTAASGASQQLAVYDESVDGTCTTLGIGSTNPISLGSGILLWSPSTTNMIYNQNGWQIYELPGDAKPFGVASSFGRVWVGDQGRQLLLRFDTQSFIYLPFIWRYNK